VPRQRHQEPTLEQTAKGVWFIRPRIDVIKDGRIERVRTTITLGGGMGKREATNRMREEMQKVNKTDAVVTSQVRFSSLLERYKLLHIPKQASSTRGKYGSHIKNHIEPFFGGLMLCEVDTEVIQNQGDGQTALVGGEDRYPQHPLLALHAGQSLAPVGRGESSRKCPRGEKEGRVRAEEADR